VTLGRFQDRVGNFRGIFQLLSVVDLKQNRIRKTRIDPYWLVERYATVMAQLHDEQGDRETLLAERKQLIEQGRRIGFLSPWMDDRPEGV
jgi:hypothetical protein